MTRSEADPAEAAGKEATGKVALITGITGQDGSYLAELLLEKGYQVHGIARRTSLFNRTRIEVARAAALARGQVYQLHYGDLGDSSSLNRIVAETRDVYIVCGSTFLQQTLMVLDKQTLAALHLAHKNRFSRSWTPLAELEREELLGADE